MDNKYFMHRIKKEDGNFVKGIEIHDSLESAIRSFWAYNVYAYNNPDYPNVTFVSLKITDINGVVLKPYDMIWQKPVEDQAFFMHHIKKDGDAFAKDIDICETLDAAMLAYSKMMAYGYDNPRFPNINYISCMITNVYGMIVNPYSETWIKPEVEPEPNVEPVEE